MKAAPAGRVQAERSEPEGSLDADAAPDTIVPGGHAPHRGHAPLATTGGSWMLEDLLKLIDSLREKYREQKEKTYGDYACGWIGDGYDDHCKALGALEVLEILRTEIRG